MSQVVGSWRRSATFKGAAGIAAASAAVQGATALASPLLTRLFTPEDFGASAVFASMLMIGVIIASLRLELAVPIARSDVEARLVLATCGILIVVSATTTAVLVAVFGSWASDVLGAPSLAPYLWLLPIALVGAGGYQSLSYYALRRRAYARVAKTRVSQGLSGLATSAAVGAITAGPLGLLLGSVVSQSAGVLSLSRELERPPRSLFWGISAGRVLSTIRRYSKFPQYSVPSGLFNKAALTLTPLLMSAFFGASSAGKYSLAMRVVGLPLVIVGEAVRQIFLGEAAAATREKGGLLWPLMAKTTKSLLPFAGVVLALGAASPFFFGFVFGPEWSDAGDYAALLALLGASQLVVSPVSNVVILVERQEVQLLLDILRAIGVVASFVVADALSASDTAALAAFVCSMVFVYVLSFFVCRRLALTHDRETKGGEAAD